jgi:hypothetical protein
MSRNILSSVCHGTSYVLLSLYKPVKKKVEYIIFQQNMIIISQQIRGNFVKIFSHKYVAIFKLNSSPFSIFLMKSCELGFESVESVLTGEVLILI